VKALAVVLMLVASVCAAPPDVIGPRLTPIEPTQ
jgi:hypothetical protein